MATYAIGDIQGCYRSLKQLLNKVRFNSQDQLWLCGDLVNRGPQSLDVLRFISDLGTRAQVVLGNHDLHLLAIHYGATDRNPGKTLEPVLAAADRNELMNWLQFQPLLVDSEELCAVMTHAGIPHIWSLAKAKACAQEVETALRSAHAKDFFAAMYGNVPATWSDTLAGTDRLRTITNYFTRMRFIAADGRLDFDANGDPKSAPQGYVPWFEHRRPDPIPRRIVSGHWAALGLYEDQQVSALDTGCVWGNQLTAKRLEDGEIFSIASQEATKEKR